MISKYCAISFKKYSENGRTLNTTSGIKSVSSCTVGSRLYFARNS